MSILNSNQIISNASNKAIEVENEGKGKKPKVMQLNFGCFYGGMCD